MDQSTLLYKINHEITLTKEEKESLYSLLSYGCREKTKNRLYNIIVKYGMIYNHYGIYDRVTFYNGKAQYTAGQSYPDEIRVVRDCILGR